ncbi:MAG: hypothetical protein K2W96_20435 [Gemmataceae bacterium]|nr:hypothetical protein [Gemmataceae bacterium]
MNCTLLSWIRMLATGGLVLLALGLAVPLRGDDPCPDTQAQWSDCKACPGTSPACKFLSEDDCKKKKGREQDNLWYGAVKGVGLRAFPTADTQVCCWNCPCVWDPLAPPPYKCKRNTTVICDFVAQMTPWTDEECP